MNQYAEFAQDYELLNPKEELFLQRDFFSQVIEKYRVKRCHPWQLWLGGIWPLHKPANPCQEKFSKI